MVTELGRALALDAIGRQWPRVGASGRMVEVGAAETGFLWIPFLIAAAVATGEGMAFGVGMYAADQILRPGDEKLADRLVREWFGADFYLSQVFVLQVDADTGPPKLTAQRAERFKFATAAARKMIQQPECTVLTAELAVRQLTLALEELRRQEKAAAAGQPVPALGPGQPLVIANRPPASSATPWILAGLGAAALGLFLLSRRR